MASATNAVLYDCTLHQQCPLLFMYLDRTMVSHVKRCTQPTTQCRTHQTAANSWPQLSIHIVRHCSQKLTWDIIYTLCATVHMHYYTPLYKTIYTWSRACSTWHIAITKTSIALVVHHGDSNNNHSISKTSSKQQRAKGMGCWLASQLGTYIQDVHSHLLQGLTLLRDGIDPMPMCCIWGEISIIVHNFMY